jgi:hypothetical protein
MQFNFPIKKINDYAWFITPHNTIAYGQVKLITIAISEEKCKTYYRMIDDTEGEHTIGEEQIMSNDKVTPTPKYEIGDGVTYNKILKGGVIEPTIDVIKHIEIAFYEKDYAEISYIMEHDEDEDWVLEEEVLGFGEMSISAEYKSLDVNV